MTVHRHTPVAICGLLLALGVLAGCAQPPTVGGSARAATEAAGQGDGNASSRVHTELAAQYYARGMYAIALQELQEAMQADARYAPAYNVLGLVHGQLREDPQAETAFQRAISLSPYYSEAHNNYGWFLCERGRIAAALERFETAVANPLYATPEKALANAGLCSLRQNNLKLAEDYLQRALIRAPYQPVALYNMARLHLHQGRAVAARNALLQLAETGPLDAPALWLGVRAERQLGDASAESSYGAQLRRRFPNSQETHWLNSAQYHLPELTP